MPRHNAQARVMTALAVRQLAGFEMANTGTLAGSMAGAVFMRLIVAGALMSGAAAQPEALTKFATFKDPKPVARS